ncbi:MAG: hypothetical protein PQJ61_11515 [Spirochaetales bacterium]|uniref:Uncharacterized protein n=1 Tax=Candidatus Thalassospirochaeta sargassi TaxID=3119039 RepID=A0AAJ1IDM5_9SPIO|nr:hypothetical protein [Spirochaetales bacterium]
MKKGLLLLLSILMISASVVIAQDVEPEDPFADAFLDPFADPESEVDAEIELEEDPFLDPFADPDAGDESVIIDDLDSMFDTESMVDEIDEEQAAAETGAVDEFLVSEGVEFGGSFSGSLSSGFDYDYLWTDDFDFRDPESSLVPSVSADLYFDARPESDYRVFGKLSFSSATGSDDDISSLIPDSGLTFETGTDEDGNITFTAVDAEDVDEDDPDQTTITQDDAETLTDDTSTAINISVPELFADFDWDDTLYFRFGKSFIKWGVGYFWSPSDVLNLTLIDVEDPTADREGPVSFKVHYPFDIHNAYLYLITDDVEEPLDTAIASKMEFVVGDTEMSIGAYYQRDLSPRAAATFSTTIGDFAVFGEGVASWGSDRVFVRVSKDQSAAEDDEEDDLELVLDTYTVDDSFFFQATIGTNYIYNFEEAGTFMMIGQYYFNGEGYDDSESGLLEAAYRLFLNSDENGLALDDDDQPDNYEDPPALDTDDIMNFGRHYVGGIVSWSSIFDSDLSFSTLAIANLSDISGMIIPTFSYNIIDYISVSAGMRMTFGEEGDEYTNPTALLGLSGDDAWMGPTMSFTLECSIGGGSF